MTDDGLVITSSEAGSVHIDEARIVARGRLGPGEMLAVELATGEVLTDRQVVERLAASSPTKAGCDENLTALDELVLQGASSTSHSARSAPGRMPAGTSDPAYLSALQVAFGYNREELVVLFRPMWQQGVEAIGSMGDDTPVAALSELPRPLFHYFYQRFAEVTNPPIDPLREAQVMSLTQLAGRRASIFGRGPEAARLLEFASPVLTNEHVAVLRELRRTIAPDKADDLRVVTLATTWPAAEGSDGLEAAVDRLCTDAVAAVKNGASLLILPTAPWVMTTRLVPSLLATATVHQALIAAGVRSHASLIVETGEARDVHHLATLVGYGASAVNPWLALQTVVDEVESAGRHGEGVTVEQAVENYCKALEKGLLKVMSKMGIATVDSYCGAQIFDALGLDDGLVRRYFPGTAARLGGIGLTQIAETC